MGGEMMPAWLPPEAAGVAGSVGYAIHSGPARKPWRWVATILIGAISSSILTPLILHLLAELQWMPREPEQRLIAAVAFLVGLFGMHAAKRIFRAKLSGSLFGVTVETQGEGEAGDA